MCGIAGWAFLNGGAKPSRVRDMADAIKHRGPDDEGYYLIDTDDNFVQSSGADTNVEHKRKYPNISDLTFSAKLCLAHRRLSIVDLSYKSHQPINEKNITLTFNGEIYNYRELRDELSSRWKFQTDGDTEVVLAAYTVWGKEAFKKFDGMWALAIYDSFQNQLILCRDRFGEKPLYYYHDKEKFIFASEIKSILASGLIDANYNSEYCLDYLLLSLPVNKTGQTFFRGISQIEPGQSIEINLIDLTAQKAAYWSLEVDTDHNVGDLRNVVDKTRDYLDISVNNRLRVDVPFVTTLSGGLDSSVLTAIASKSCEPGDLQTYCLGGHADDHDTYFAKKVQEKLGVKLKFVNAENELAQGFFENLIWHADEPIRDMGGNNGGGSLLYAAIKADGYKVVLEGNGADEFLAGYPGIFLPYRFLDVRNLTGLIETLKWSKNENFSVRKLSFLIVQSLIKRKRLKNMLPGLKNKFSTNRSLGSVFFKNQDQFLDIFNQHSSKEILSDMKSEKIDFIKNNAFSNYIKNADRISMAHSIECRLPFLSKDFSTFALNIPAEFQIKNGFSKYNLRAAYADILPEEVVWRRKKQGFTAPADKWLNSINNLALESIAASSFLNNNFKINEIFSYYKGLEIKNFRLEELHFLWRLYSFSIWEKMFISDTQKNKLGKHNV